MPSEKSPEVPFPICQQVRCLKNICSDRVFWRKEIDHQYEFYVATLRAERDARYLIQEHSNLLSQAQEAGALNLKLRKEIRTLETELFVMYQRNAHDSPIIDGLQEVHYEAEQKGQLESQMRHKIDMVTEECSHEDTLIKILKEEVSLLKRKEVEDAELIESLKPLEEQLKNTLADEKLKTHQQSMKERMSLEAVLREFEKRNTDLEAICSERSSAILWVFEMFSGIIGNEVGIHQRIVSDSEQTSEESSQETDPFDVSVEEDIPVPGADDLGENFQSMKEEYCEFVAMKELLNTKNMVNIRVVYNCLQQFSECMKNLANEYVSVFETLADIAFIREYLERLNMMRQKKDIVNSENSIRIAQRLEQLELIYNSLVNERAFLANSIEHFAMTVPEDFKAHCVILQKTEELFVNSSPPEAED